MIDNAVDGTQSQYLIMGLAIFIVPALMFMIHGIKEKRAIMFMIHAFILAFWTYVWILNTEDFSKSALAIFSDTTDILVLLAEIAVLFFFWMFIIRFFFRRKN